ncbi:glycosyltransferase family 10 [Marinomonas sp. C2222]|uniref:Glycosyltransferase family 10 n=1 Tax=Marinomonas sargassi TaxID=2984494 RepID=A0ABT2YP27_9GAMM|nr:glycosyltransferase family 10 [Marinomonas sargassi]MCV2401637.1 glycosyltransferase family 10 [Marinomonas sargassi]
MKKASIVMSSDYYNNNRLFDLNDKISNRDDCLYPYSLLKDKLYEKGYLLATSDIHDPSTSDIVLYNEMPRSFPLKSIVEKSYLLLFESELIRPDNWDVNKHSFFKKVFTWNDAYVSNDQYIKFNFPNTISFPQKKNNQLKLCTLIAGNKKSAHPLELYSKRVQVIRWFEENHPEDFEFYGIGWDAYRFTGPKYIRILNRIRPICKILAPTYSSYKGKVEAKREVLEQYKFAICFENARDIPGYITEKIFDCFFSGCIPIYWGANNIEEHIPSNCFIDFNQFESLNEMYCHISSMPEAAYDGYLASINEFLRSNACFKFSAEYFVNKVTDVVLKENKIEE